MSKGSKWAFLKGKYDKLPLDADYQAKVDAVLNSPAPKWALGIADSDLELSIRLLSDEQVKQLYLRTRKRSDNLAKKMAVLNLEEEAFCRLFCERFEDAGEMSKTFTDGVTIRVSSEPYPTCKDKGALDKWLEKKGLLGLKTLNFQTMQSMVKERLEGKVNEALPDGIEVYLKDKLSCGGRPK